MNRYIYILLFATGIIGFYSTAFAQIGIQCNTTVKCVCESQNHVRVVPCPAENSSEAIDCTKEGLPEGTCEVDCGQEVGALCDEIGIECRNDERASCQTTLPVDVYLGCPPEETNCNDQCVDTNTDNANCGECDNVCATRETCVSGVCECEPGLIDCGSFAGCVDLNSNSSNCGECFNQCATAQICRAGDCKTGNYFPCNAGSECFSGNCVDGYCCPFLSPCR